MMASTPTVVIAGATGFVGRALSERLGDRYRIVGLTRAAVDPPPYPGVEWRRCDLFSLLECEEALAGAEYAVYLVHSMLPSARLTQGAFQDMDLIIADNFARAAARAGVKQIVYLGGLAPEGPALSSHLRSRLEVEETLGAHGVPVTALRAGIIVGAGGSSFEMLVRLVRCLPVVPCPQWAHSPSQPIALADALDLLSYCLAHPSLETRHFEIGCPEVLTYRQMLERMAAILGLRRRFVDVPLSGTLWCRRWLTLVTGAPRELVGPLLESMQHPMIARDRRLQELAGLPGLPFDAAVRAALAEGAPCAAPQGGRRRIPGKSWRRSDVRSVQRIPLPQGRTACWAAEQYSAWLPLLLRTFIRAEADADKNVRVILHFPRISLLTHRFARDRSEASDRQVFYINGGLLARRVRRATQRPRLEFREVLGGSCLIVAVHDYRPTLPWPLYNLTQARIHPWVIRRFARHLLHVG
jgi:uncharacterized protein YbjT (DUF2867 family)